MNIEYLILAIIILIFTGIKAKKSFYDVKKFIGILLIGMTLSLSVLVFPINEGKNMVSKAVFSIIYAAQTIILAEDVSLADTININGIVEILYLGIIYILYLAMPLLTASFLLSLIDDFTTKIKLYFASRGKVIIFSEINEKSLILAEKLKAKNTIFIFANCSNEVKDKFHKDIKTLKVITVPESVENINLKNIKSKDITYYMITEQSDDDLEQTLQIIEKYKHRPLNIYVITNSDIARTILDSTDKGNIRVEIVNEMERTVYKVLTDMPLYMNAINNEISVLIVGAGKVGREFLKAITWCGQIIGYKLKITVIDKRANFIKEKLDKHYPELLEKYEYNFIEADINSKKMTEELDKIDNINYIIIALNEELNIKEAIFLRKYFICRDKKEFKNKPIINVWVENYLKNKQVNVLKNEKNNEYDFNAFGSVKQIYYDDSIINSKLEKMTQNVHLSYNPNDIELKNFYEKEYNIRSSRATALHIQYKLYSVLKEEYTGNLEKDLEKFEELLKDKEIVQKLAKNEHDRWLAYMRSDGYSKASLEQVNNYIKNTNSYKHHLAKMHPALVEYEQLDEIGEKLGVDLKAADEEIIKGIPEIIKKSL